MGSCGGCAFWANSTAPNSLELSRTGSCANSCTGVLDLEWRQLNSIALGTFGGLNQVTELLLGGNRLTTIEAGIFVGLPALRSLFLYSNEIAEIHPGAFDGLNQVRHA